MAHADTWNQMGFVSPEGRKEVLWVEQQLSNEYKVLSVPVWIYGISLGTIVAADGVDGSTLRFGRLVRESAGGTVRFIVPRGVQASEVYLSRIIPDAKQRRLYIGPATFFNPRLVSVHVHQRRDWWPEVGGYFDELVKDGILQQWEVGDPDKYAGEHAETVQASPVARDRSLVHPLPIDGTDWTNVS